MRFAVQFEDCGTKRRKTELPDREFDHEGRSQKYFNPLELSRDLLAPFVAVVGCADPPTSEDLAGMFPREALGTMRDDGVFCVDGDNLNRGWGECVDESTPVE